jgi:hypothetical protein
MRSGFLELLIHVAELFRNVGEVGMFKSFSS